MTLFVTTLCKIKYPPQMSLFCNAFATLFCTFLEVKLTWPNRPVSGVWCFFAKFHQKSTLFEFRPGFRWIDSFWHFYNNTRHHFYDIIFWSILGHFLGQFWVTFWSLFWVNFDNLYGITFGSTLRSLFDHFFVTFLGQILMSTFNNFWVCNFSIKSKN